MLTKVKLTQFSIFWTATVLVASASALLGLTLAPIAVQAAGSIKIDGSSTVFPITEAVAEEFQKANPGSQVSVGVSGTGGGMKKFCAGEIDIANASRPIKESEMADCKAKGIRYVEMPIAIEAITVVVNPKNTWANNLTVAELKKIWEPNSQVKNWSQVRSGFPNQPISLFGPGTDSGTFDYFTEAIVGKSKSSRADYTASEDDNILVQGVSKDANALAYFGFSYYKENQQRLKAIGVDAGKGPIVPSVATIKDQSYTPLTRPLFIYVSDKARNRPEMKKFISFYMQNAPKLVGEVGDVALSPSEYRSAQRHFDTGRFGTVFAGKPTSGMKIADILKLAAKD
jgi:phosphate transport system substrate-binding protein